jgi:hypothetical protein
MSIARDAKAHADAAADQGRRLAQQAVGQAMAQTRAVGAQTLDLAGLACTQLRSRGDAWLAKARAGEIPGVDPERLDDVRARLAPATRQAAQVVGQARAAGAAVGETVADRVESASHLIEQQAEQVWHDPRLARLVALVESAPVAAGVVHDHLVAPVLRTVGLGRPTSAAPDAAVPDAAVPDGAPDEAIPTDAVAPEVVPTDVVAPEAIPTDAIPTEVISPEPAARESAPRTPAKKATARKTAAKPDTSSGPISAD